MVASLYLPEFPAWATYRCARPSRPVVVVHRGRVVSASPRALRAGVEAGMAAERAVALLPRVHVAVRDRALETAAWEEALEAALELTPFVESVEPGWAFLRDADFGALAALAERLGARAGLAPSRGVSRLAAVRAAPRYLLVVAEADVGAFLAGTGVEALVALGWSEEMAERLGLLGYGDLRKVRGLTKRHLQAQFGLEGEAAYRLLHPSADERPVSAFAPPPTLRSHVDLDDDVREPGTLVPAAELLAREAGGCLGPFRCRRVTVRAWVRGADEARVARRILPDSVADPARLARTAAALVVDLLGPDVWVHGLSVELSALDAGCAEQVALFRTRPSSRMAVRGVHRRFPGAIRRALVVTDAHFHEDAVRYEPYPEDEAPVRRRAS